MDVVFYNKPIEETIENLSQFLTKRTEKNKELLLKLIHCLYDIQEHGLTTKHFNLLNEGLRHTWDLIYYYYSGQYIAKLTHYYKEAEDILIQLSQDKKAQNRAHAVLILIAKPTKRVIDKIINNCVNDKSKIVKLAVANIIRVIGSDEYIEVLKDALTNETRSDIINQYKNVIELLTHGYYLTKNNDQFTSITFKESNGLKYINVLNNDVDKVLIEHQLK